MCYGRWTEAGRPMLVSTEIRAAAMDIGTLYMEFSGAGGNLHIVVDDWNTADVDLEFCRRIIDRTANLLPFGRPEQHELERRILDELAPMTDDERLSVLALACGFITPRGEEILYAS